MSFIIDLNLVCLVCLQEGELQSVFNKNESNISIGDKIMKCSELCINEKMRMPDKICTSCTTDLEVAYRFRLNCETAKMVFKSIIKQEITPEIPPEISLNDQKIKIPPGLKIKKIQSTHKPSVPQTDSLPEENKVITIQQEDVFEVVQDLDEEENYSTTDYFENAEILEEDEILETFDELDAYDANTEVVDVKTEHAVKLEHQIKQEDMKSEIPEVFTTEIKMDLKTKRGRGRPRKLDKLIEEKIRESTLIDKKPVIPEVEDFLDNKVFIQTENGIDSSSIRYYNPRRKPTSIEVKPSKICDICGNSYKYQHALNSHMRRHRNERPFSCEFCDKAFVSAVELRRHMRVHTGQKPYACQYCERRFSDFGSRIKHERTHTGERPYICSTCGKGFAYAHVLSVHMRTHTGEKKYKCEECGKGFTKKSYLESHMSHHNSGPNENVVTIKHVVIDECIISDETDNDNELKVDPTVAETIMEEEVHYETIVVP